MLLSVYYIYTYKPLPYPSPTPWLARFLPRWRVESPSWDQPSEHTVTRNHHFCPSQAVLAAAKIVMVATTTVLAAAKPVLAAAKTVLEAAKTVLAAAKTVYTKSQPCFFTKSVRFGRTELFFFFRVANREIYNLSMVSGPVLLKILKKIWIFIYYATNKT